MADYLLGIDYGTGGAGVHHGHAGRRGGFAFEEYPLFTRSPAGLNTTPWHTGRSAVV